ncbi:unnamed protein product [Paramecium primaurelia]|uniref:Uncharacterized protein n=1 Tax=Paramecium primaurelia TaxID=5886 RepID=A0A8S1QSM9_PARPR|nr:unnamed protein product [Paramecium primaurelia]
MIQKVAEEDPYFTGQKIYRLSYALIRNCSYLTVKILYITLFLITYLEKSNGYQH